MPGDRPGNKPSDGPGDLSGGHEPLDPGQLGAAFAAEFGHEPAGVWAGPGRVNLIGEHTDYNDGFALPLALPRRVLLAGRARDDGMLVLRSRQQPATPASVRTDRLAPGAISGWAAYVAGVAWALRDAGFPAGGAELLVDADLPVGSGLASSAALECAAAVALDELWSLGASRAELARLCQRAENDFVGMPCGVMDQMASLRALDGHALFLDCRDLSVAEVPFAPEPAGLALLVVDTRAAHRHVDGAYADRRRGCERAAAALGVRALRELDPADLEAALTRLDSEARRYVRHVVTENERVRRTVERLHHRDVAGTGRLLTESHRSLRDDYRVSCPELDLAVDAALGAGALGARMTGGGFGGCAIALAGRDRAATVATAVRDAFRARDFAEPRTFPAAPSGGASRVH